MENQTTLNTQPTTIVEPVVQQKTSNFLTILLSALLLISVSIAGFFAYQTQKLVAELRIKNDELSQTQLTPNLEQTNGPELTAEQDKTLDPTADWKTYTNEKI